MAKGMETEEDRERDRQNWQKSIERRHAIIAEAKRLNIRLKNPHGMKMKELEALVAAKTPMSSSIQIKEVR